MKEQINAITRHQERLKDVIEHLEAEKYNIQSYKENCRLYKQEIRQLERKADKLQDKINIAIDKLYCYGEVFDGKILQQFQQEMLDILQGVDK